MRPGEKILGAQEDLEKAQEKADEQYESMKLRIRYMYENGQTDAVEALISSTDFSDFINKAEYISNVHTYDRQQLKALKDTEQEIQDLKTTLEEEQDRQEEMQAAYEEQEEELNATLIEKRAEIADFDQQIQAAAEAAARAAQAQEQQAGGGEDGQAAPDRRRRRPDPRRGGTASTPSGGTSNGGTSNGGTSNGGTSNSGTSNGGTSGGSTSGGSTNSGSSAGNTSVAQTIVNAAYGQLGVPYVYGGSTPGAGLDCSGLVQYCHSVAGISLPRTSYEQGGCGVAVSNPQPGDIVCYGSHVGIYIGGGQMIHAPKPGDVVKVAAVYGSPWYRRCW